MVSALQEHDIFSELWGAVERRLRDTPEFLDPPSLQILRRGDGDQEKELQASLGAAGHAGAVVFVEEPMSQPLGRLQINATVAIDIAEDPALSRGVGGNRRTGRSVAACIIGRLCHWREPLLPIGPMTLVGSERPDEGGGFVHRLTFRCGIFNPIQEN